MTNQTKETKNQIPPPPTDERNEKITRILEIAMVVVFAFLVLCLIMTF